MEATGKEIVCKIFEAENVRYIFGNPGSTEVPLLDHLCNYPAIKYVLALHENVAVAMADGYARASGNPGIVSLHAAPGTAHSLGALYNARKDNVPLILIGGNQDSRLLIREPFLAADLIALAESLTKWRWHVSRIEELPIAVRRAFKEATTPPCGPVYLSIARNVLDEVMETEEAIAPQRYRVPGRIRGDSDEITKAAELLADAENPVIIAGMGVVRSGAVSELVRLAEVISARVHTEPGAFPTNHELYVGQSDLTRASDLMANADVVLVVGARMFAEMAYSAASPIPPGAKAIHLDISPWEIAKNVPLDAAILADPKVALNELVHSIQGMLNSGRLDNIERRKADIAESARQRENALRKALDGDGGSDFVRTSRLCVELKEVLDEDAIVVEEGLGSTTYLRKYFPFSQPGTLVATGAGSLGWGIGAAMGTKLARPDKQVIAFVGDGASMYYPQALWTAARENLPIVVILLNNGGYMAIKSMLTGYKGEALKQRKYIGADIGGIDYVKLAESFGVTAVRVEEESKLKSALEEAVCADRPVLVEVLLDPKDAGFGRQRIP